MASIPIIKLSGAALVAALFSLGFVTIHQEPSERFAEFFINAKTSMSSSGLIPTWEGEINVCIYGTEATESTRRRLDAVLNFHRQGIGIPLTSSRAVAPRSCPDGTDIFVHLHEGPVFREDVEANYQEIAETTGVEVVPQTARGQESAFGQVAFMTNPKRAVAAVLLNQISSAPNRAEVSFVNDAILEELYQAIVIGADVSTKEAPRSILEERFIATPSLWQGKFSEEEAVAYLETRPQGLCVWDVMLARLLYGAEVATADPTAYEAVIKRQYDRMLQDAVALMEGPQWADIVDLGCGD